MQIRNEQEFDEQLEKLDGLYEGIKDCLHILTPTDMKDLLTQQSAYNKLKQLRDMCAVQLQRMHWVDQN